MQEIVEKTEAELAAAADKRREQGKRLQEMQARQRAEKVGSLPPQRTFIELMGSLPR